MRWLLAILVTGVMATQMNATTQAKPPIQKADVKKIERFCDLGFRFTRESIDSNLSKLLNVLQLGAKVDPKTMQTVDSLAAVEIVLLIHYCHLYENGDITADQYMKETEQVLHFAADLKSVREQADKQAGVKPAPSDDEPHLDPTKIAKNELGITVESSISLDSGDMTVILKTLTKRYLCQCRAGQ